jgi:CHAT domain-containing protein
LLYRIEKKLRGSFFGTAAKQQQQKESRRWAESAIETAFDLWGATRRQEYADKVLLIAEMSKAQLLLDEMISNLHYKNLKHKDTLLERERRTIQAIHFYEKESSRYDSNAVTARKELQYELSLLQKELRSRYPVQAVSEELPSVEKLLKSLDAETEAVEFFTGERNIYRIIAGKDKVRQLHRTPNAMTVLQTVQHFSDQYFQSGSAKMMNDPQAYFKAAYTVYQLLFENAALKTKDCIIIPDGILGYLPFDALVTKPAYSVSVEQWPFLVKRTNLYLCYSLQTKDQQQRHQYPSQQFSGFFISFDSSNTAIPAVKKEFESIRSVMKGSYFLEGQASLNNFDQQLNEANVLHISTHSFMQGKENVPVLQLADSRFFLFELYGKKIHPQLVVLSACRTGQGMLAKGEGIISLARGFTATGAAGIVAGLWDMNDEATAVLAGNFYRSLNNGKRPAAALHDAKLDWLQDKDLQHFQKLPYFWAGMVYCGDNSQVKLDAADKFSRWWIVGGLIITALFIYIKRKRLAPLTTGKRPR